MTSKLTRGPLFAEVHNVPDDYHFTAEELDRIIAGDMFTPRQGAIMARELQGRRKAERDSEPVFFIEVEGDDWINAGRIPGSTLDFNDLPDGVNKLYASPQPAPEREQVRREHAEWSQATFGNVGPIGPLKHLRREVLETIKKPHDLIEWADMQFLLWDAQSRAGITDEQITQAMTEKLAVNKLREWPEPKDGEPRLHTKEQPASLVPEDVRQALSKMDDEIIAELDTEESDCRADMLQENEKSAGAACNCRSSEIVQVMKDHQIRELVHQLRDIAVKYHATGQLREQIARVVRSAMLQAGYSPPHSGIRPEQSSTSPAHAPSRERFISLCNEFWNWSEMDLVCAEDRGYELRMEWDGDVFKHPVTQALWRMYQAAPTGIPMIPDGYVMVPKEPTKE